MIHTQAFSTPHAAADYFNAPANAHLRLVGVLPPDGTATYTAIYEDAPDYAALALEEERLRLLDERIVALWQAPAEAKERMNFPRAIAGKALVPLSIVSNRLSQLAAFKALDKDERAEWIRENLDAVGCTHVPAEEARERHGCTAELAMIGGLGPRARDDRREAYIQNEHIASWDKIQVALKGFSFGDDRSLCTRTVAAIQERDALKAELLEVREAWDKGYKEMKRHLDAVAKPALVQEPQYRMLEYGEMIYGWDEYLNLSNEWKPTGCGGEVMVNATHNTVGHMPHRRRVNPT